MPRILNYTPPWLSRPSPGSKIFSDTESSQTPLSPPKPSQLGSPNGDGPEGRQGPLRLLARRGTEIFTVVDNKIRWANLSNVKNYWEERGNSDVAPYRVLSAPIYQRIRQLIISPSGKFLAILTEHTVHVAVLPDPSRLVDQDRSSLKLKTYQLGPTTHVIPQSQLVCALWHPLGASSNSTDCLMTLTAEAAVRVWELDKSNNWSFDRPALAIDLKKLIDGTSCDQDFEPSGFGKTRGFSADVFDMEATSACFGGQGFDQEDGWAAMTLWVSMRNGDVYALCPLLPSRWYPSSTTIPSLSTSVVSRMASVASDDLDVDEKRALQQQYEWVQEIDREGPILVDSDAEPFSSGELRLRPSNPSAIPRLQGPFEISLEDDGHDFDVSDIHVIASKLDLDELMSNEEDDYADIAAAAQDDLEATLICLGTTSGQVHVLLDMEGVSGQWLPKSGRNTFGLPMSDSRELILVESLSLIEPEPNFGDWLTFCQDVNSRYSLFLTTSQQITFISLAEWASRLNTEISLPVSDDSGLALRLKGICDSSTAFQEDVLNIAEDSEIVSACLCTPIVLQDSEIGYMLLTATATHPYAISFDQLNTYSSRHALSRSRTTSLSPKPPNLEDFQDSTPSEPKIALSRASYVPHAAFYESTTAPLKHFLAKNVPRRQMPTLKHEVRLSPDTLNIMTSLHQIFSIQTSQLEKAAADLFRRCDRLREELSDQVKQMSDLSSRIQRTNSEDENEERPKSGFERRLAMVKTRQQRLVERHEALRRKVARAGAGGKELSSKETGWIQEIRSLGHTVGVDGEGDRTGENLANYSSLDTRYEMVQQLARELLEQAKSVQKDQSDKDEGRQTSALGRSTSSTSQRSSIIGSSLLVPSKLQKAKIAEAMNMVEREGAVIDAVITRLERLKSVD